jgi:Uri superfamily endonuclease
MQATYTLLIELSRPLVILVGKRGNYNFKAGNYAYVGSALNGLEQRIGRHLRNDKKLHWHIDYLLQHAAVRAVIYAESSEKQECRISRELLNILESLPGFGCSDCRCSSHLFFHDDKDALRKAVLAGFMSAGLVPVLSVY